MVLRVLEYASDLLGVLVGLLAGPADLLVALISAETSAGGLLWCFVTVCPWEVFCGLLWLAGCLSGRSDWLGLLVCLVWQYSEHMLHLANSSG